MTSATRFAAWALLLAVAVMTVGPITLRPETVVFPVNLERLAAWTCLAALFSIAYPGRAALTAMTLIIAAGLLELAQLSAFGRHAEVLDFLFKSLGILIGVGVVRGIGYFQSRLKRA
jgi:hypothetical protein